MKKIILALAAITFIGIGGSAVSAQTPPTPLPNTPRPLPAACSEWDGVSPIPEICVDFYIDQTNRPPVTTAVPATSPPTVPGVGLPRTGSSVSGILGIGALLLVGGAITVVATRRRSTSRRRVAS